MYSGVAVGVGLILTTDWWYPVIVKVGGSAEGPGRDNARWDSVKLLEGNP